MQLRTFLGTVAALAVTAVVGLGLASPALATTYGPQSGSATVSATSVANGGTVTVGGDGFCPGSQVTVTVSQGGTVYITRTVRANNSGKVSLSLTLTQSGSNSITLTGQQSDCCPVRVIELVPLCVRVSDKDTLPLLPARTVCVM
jgi:hypothetical protein